MAKKIQKRLTFQCGKCLRQFSFKKEIGEQDELIFACPFCGTELVLKLDPFKKKKMNVTRSAHRGEEQPEDWEYAFPEVIPLSPREQ